MIVKILVRKRILGSTERKKVKACRKCPYLDNYELEGHFALSRIHYCSVDGHDGTVSGFPINDSFKKAEEEVLSDLYKNCPFHENNQEEKTTKETPELKILTKLIEHEVDGCYACPYFIGVMRPSPYWPPLEGEPPSCEYYCSYDDEWKLLSTFLGPITLATAMNCLGDTYKDCPFLEKGSV